jgi:hypothetical protein
MQELTTTTTTVAEVSTTGTTTPGCTHEPIDLDLSRIIHNNLGGLGPDSDAPLNIRFGAITTVGSTEVDLVVTSLAGYQSSKVEKNGFAGDGKEILQIVQQSGTTMALEFAFVDAKTDSPVTLHNFAFSFLDIDGYPGNENCEAIAVCGSTHYFMGEGLEEVHAQLCHKFKPKELASRPNPADLKSMTPLQRAHTVTAEFDAASGFVVTSSITSGKNHRPFLFAGTRVNGKPLDSFLFTGEKVGEQLSS